MKKQTLIPVNFFSYPSKKSVNAHKRLEKKVNPHLNKKTKGKVARKPGYRPSAGAKRFVKYLEDINYQGTTGLETQIQK